MHHQPAVVTFSVVTPALVRVWVVVTVHVFVDVLNDVAPK
jgi:hypothetical protein